MEDMEDKELHESKHAIFSAVTSGSRADLKSALCSADPSIILQSLLVTAYENEDGVYGHDPADMADAQELLGLDCTHLNILQVACFLGEEDLANDLMDFFSKEVEALGTRKILYEFMGRIWGQGNVSLHLASFMGMSDLVARLLDLGANPNKRNGRGYRAVDCADDDATLLLFQGISQVIRIPMPSHRMISPIHEDTISPGSLDSREEKDTSKAPGQHSSKKELGQVNGVCSSKWNVSHLKGNRMDWFLGCEGNGLKRERERKSVCVCVCVYVREVWPCRLFSSSSTESFFSSIGQDGGFSVSRIQQPPTLTSFQITLLVLPKGLGTT